jgi:Zn-dependent protease with chaperone function
MWDTVLMTIQAYLAVGAVVWLGLVTVGLRFFEGGPGSSIPFRVLILPATCVLWPVVLLRGVSNARGASKEAS